MSAPRHLVIFAKAPCLGRVKRRLAEGIGPLAALRFYRGESARLVLRLARDRRWHCRVAVTPDRLRTGRLWPRSCPRLPQGQGDLGRRMARILRGLPPGPAIIIGSDIPEVTAAAVAEAFYRLGAHDLVFGPAEDGGFWLVGTRTRQLPYGLFERVRWSTGEALADTLSGLPKRLRIGFCRRLADIDDADAWRRWRWRAGAARVNGPRGAP